MISLQMPSFGRPHQNRQLFGLDFLIGRSVSITQSPEIAET